MLVRVKHMFCIDPPPLTAIPLFYLKLFAFSSRFALVGTRVRDCITIGRDMAPRQDHMVTRVMREFLSELSLQNLRIL